MERGDELHPLLIPRSVKRCQRNCHGEAPLSCRKLSAIKAHMKQRAQLFLVDINEASIDDMTNPFTIGL